MNVQIEPLRINQSDLNTKRMMDLMAITQDDSRMPLYPHAINRILREMRMIQQQTNGTFNYAEFKRQVANTTMIPAQLAPLTQRLDTLESFMPKSQTEETPTKKTKDQGGNSWTIQPGSLTIVDLSFPCVTPEGACALFNMCLSLFLEQKTKVGRVVARDEAHKYMNDGSEATALTNTLLSSIRLQRHLGARVFISTQELTISPKLLDLCSFTIVHRFSSPDWLKCLKSHLAALDIEEDSVDTQKTKMINVFNQIVKLRVGEALIFAPSVTTGIEATPAQSGFVPPKMIRLGLGFMKIRIRGRITTDGGKSVMATGTSSIPVDLRSAKPSQTTTKSPAGPAIATTQSQKAASSTSSTFGAPSPIPRAFDGLRAQAPLPAAVEDLKKRGMLGFGHTPPVTRKAPDSFDAKLAGGEKLVHGTENSNIFANSQRGEAFHGKAAPVVFGHWTGDAARFAKDTNTGFKMGTDLQLKKENRAHKKTEAVEPLLTTRNKNLSGSIFASPKGATAQVIHPALATPTPNKPLGATNSLKMGCPGTWPSLFVPHSEIEALPNQPTGMQNVFQHVGFSPAFSKFSQEE